MEKSMSLQHRLVRRSGMSCSFAVVSVACAFSFWVWKLCFKTADRIWKFSSVPLTLKKTVSVLSIASSALKFTCQICVKLLGKHIKVGYSVHYHPNYHQSCGGSSLRTSWKEICHFWTVKYLAQMFDLKSEFKNHFPFPSLVIIIFLNCFWQYEESLAL